METRAAAINRENEYRLFCNTPADYPWSLEDKEIVLEQIEEEYNRGHARITFTGREPTLDANLTEYIAAAKRQGSKRIQSKRMRLSFPTLRSRKGMSMRTYKRPGLHAYLR